MKALEGLAQDAGATWLKGELEELAGPSGLGEESCLPLPEASGRRCARHCGLQTCPCSSSQGQRASYSTNASKFLICKMATTGLAHDRDAGKMTGDDVHRALRRVPGWSKESVNANHEYNQLATPSHSAAEHITLSQAPGFAPAVPSTWNTISHLA